MTNLPVIDDFINFNKKVGPLGMIEIGLPGSGKSSHATETVILCMERKNESVLMHGDISCEWRHFLRYSKYIKSIVLLVPKDADLFYSKNFNPSKYKVPFELIIVDDFSQLDIVHYLEEGQLTVVYDDCFERESKTVLWRNIAKQLITRRVKNKLIITYLCHEAGNYYPQTAKGEQWGAVDEFCDFFVFFRKRGIRALLLTQLENEVYDRLRKKCFFRAYRICYPSNRTHARKIKKYILNMTISNYHLFYGDLYNPMRENKPVKEIRMNWLIVPRDLINLNGKVGVRPSSENHQLLSKALKNLYINFNSDRELERITGLDYRTVQKYRKIDLE